MLSWRFAEEVVKWKLAILILAGAGAGLIELGYRNIYILLASVSPSADIHTSLTIFVCPVNVFRSSP